MKNRNFKDYGFIVGFFSAEELGLIGSTFYYIDNKFDKDRLHVVSVDMIGEKGPLVYVKGINPIKQIAMDSIFNSLIESIAKKLEIEVKGKNFPYPGSDFASWLIDGYKANWFSNKSEVIHSKKDNIDSVDEKLVNDALKLIVGYLIEFC